MPVGLVDHFNVVLAPSQVEATLRFYTEVLGLTTGLRPGFGRPGWWMYTGKHPVLHISLKEAVPSTAGATGCLDHIALNATGWRDMKARLERHSVPYDEQRVRDNTVLQIFFRDTNGLRVELDYQLVEDDA